MDYAQAIRDRLAEWTDIPIDAVQFGREASRQLRERQDRDGFSLSALGSCARKIGYKLKGEPKNGKALDARSRATFFIGDALEVFLASVLENTLQDTGHDLHLHGGAQSRVEVTIGGMVVAGHRDGEIITPDGERITLEIKSMSNYGFRKFKEAEGWGKDESYYWQHQGYLNAENTMRGYVLGICKNSGSIAGYYTEISPEFYTDAATHMERAHAMIRMLPDGAILAPANDLHKSRGTPNKGHGKLPWQCAYCDYYKTCWPTVQEESAEDFMGNPKTDLYVR